jgi:endonuclease/exonuclease/phosphatase family metal-dependent hydrolase
MLHLRNHRFVLGLVAMLALVTGALALAAPRDAAAQAPAPRPDSRGGTASATATPTPSATAGPRGGGGRAGTATTTRTPTPVPAATRTSTATPVGRGGLAPLICRDCDPCLWCESPDPTPTPTPTRTPTPTPTPTPTSRTLNVMTYNIGGGWWFKPNPQTPNGLPWVPDYYVGGISAIADEIRTKKIDIAILQEVRRHWDADTNWDDQVTLLKEMTGMYAVYTPSARWYRAPFCPGYGGYASGDSGLLILSKFPIRDIAPPPAASVGYTYDIIQCAYKYSWSYVLQEVEIDVAGMKVRVYNLHNPNWNQGDQYILPNYLLDRVRQRPANTAVLAGGDYNCKIWLYCTLPLLNDKFRHVCDLERGIDPGCGQYFDVNHLFVWDEAPRFQVTDAYMDLNKVPSDHTPLVAQVSL